MLLNEHPRKSLPAFAMNIFIFNLVHNKESCIYTTSDIQPKMKFTQEHFYLCVCVWGVSIRCFKKGILLFYNVMQFLFNVV